MVGGIVGGTRLRMIVGTWCRQRNDLDKEL